MKYIISKNSIKRKMNREYIEVIFMAHCRCINGHDMWNGDGKPVIWAFSIRYIKDYVKRFPDVTLGTGMQIYDLFNDEDELDCWYCDECHSLTVFINHYRYDFVRFDVNKEMKITSLSNWEDYIALRNIPFDEFSDWYDGMNPLTAIENYKFDYLYKVSSDKQFIYAIDSHDEIAFGFQQVRLIDYNQEINSD